jgi:hypothetical protein
MSDNKQQKGIKEGPPIWVSSLLTREEWVENFKKYATCTVPSPPEYDPTYYKGGKWRNN